MKSRSILLVAVACLALPSLAAAAAPAVTASGCAPSTPAVSPDEPLFTSTFSSLAVCSADCEDGSTISCSGSSCSAQDQNCDLDIQGHVICDGIIRDRCDVCEPVCEENDTRQVRDGCCQGSGYEKQQWRFDECVNGQWEVQSWSCAGECLLQP